ncbi:hypothetical protein GALMADRAFT_148715 [Galerina marginata CBS 339.88]|uniref:Uncharacterized protein n=1 Tax=Galerina marginata (strain CBS 339.88) TaxID=685588 RepID=A0A067S695_GALM3|nr:hypothetical protein GALMADRAFT_148715 [Galerina marginata CBS 339.88]
MGRAPRCSNALSWYFNALSCFQNSSYACQKNKGRQQDLTSLLPPSLWILFAEFAVHSSACDKKLLREVLLHPSLHKKSATLLLFQLLSTPPRFLVQSSVLFVERFTMVNPGAFRGSRKEFLMGEKEEYARGVADGCAGEAVALIYRRYFKRFPLDLPHDEEPTADHLAAVDDEAIDADYEEPDPERMSPEEYGIALAKLENRQQTLEFRKAQIRRWLAYQYMKDHDINPKESGAQNPYQALLSKLTGKDIGRPRQKLAINLWRQTKRDLIESNAKARAQATNTSTRMGLAPIREKIAREMFNKLDDLEQRRWKDEVLREHRVAIAEWKKEMAKDTSTAPEDRQRCIMGLVQFVQPILDLLCDATGWKATLIAGGPEPAHDGRLNIISVHSGTTTGDIPMNFGRAERQRFQKHIVPIYGSFLQKCYSPEECHSRALSQAEGFMSMESLGVDSDSANLDTVDAMPASSTGSSLNETATTASPTPWAPGGNGLIGEPPSSRPQVQPSPPASRPPSPPASPPPSPPASPPPSLPASRPPSPPVSRPPSPPVSHPPAQEASVPASADPDVQMGSRSSRPPSPPISQSQAPPSSGAASETARPAMPPDTSASSVATRARRSGRKGTKVGAPTSQLPPASNEMERTTSTSEGGGGAGGRGARGQKHGPGDSKNPPAKRPRTSQRTLEAVTNGYQQVEPAPEAPEWFKNALEMLQDEKLRGKAQWGELLKAWAAFESQEKYNGTTKLKSKHRPGLVGNWIRRARSAKWRPDLVDIPQFTVEFSQWWASLQPDWRLSIDDEVLFEEVGAAMCAIILYQLRVVAQEADMSTGQFAQLLF